MIPGQYYAEIPLELQSLSLCLQAKAALRQTTCRQRGANFTLVLNSGNLGLIVRYATLR